MASPVPPAVDLPYEEIRTGRVVVEPAALRGARLAGGSWEEPGFADPDRGLTVGGAETAAWGWARGRHFPTAVAQLLLRHPELARFFPSYELALTTNEDQWRNGVQTAGYAGRWLKELAAQKVCRLVRGRWGIDHSTAALFQAALEEYGAGAAGARRDAAVARARRAALHVDRHAEAPAEVFSPLERALLSWTEELVVRPHGAWRREGELRAALDAANQREIAAGVRRLDASPALDEAAARARLLHHQIAELTLAIGHRDGLCRLATILRLEAEPARGSRPGIHGLLRELGVDDAVATLNELTVNPALANAVRRRLGSEPKVAVAAAEAAASGEF
jgi:hypothetical protein